MSEEKRGGLFKRSTVEWTVAQTRRSVRLSCLNDSPTVSPNVCLSLFPLSIRLSQKHNNQSLLHSIPNLLDLFLKLSGFCKCSLTCPRRLSFFHPPQSSLSLSGVSAVIFEDCGGEEPVALESSRPHDFRIEADGVIYAARRLRIAEHRPAPLVVTASRAAAAAADQRWETKIQLTPHTHQVCGHAFPLSPPPATEPPPQSNRPC